MSLFDKHTLPIVRNADWAIQFMVFFCRSGSCTHCSKGYVHHLIAYHSASWLPGMTSCINSFSSLHQFNPYLIYFVQLSVKVLRCLCVRSGFELCIKFAAERERCTHVVVLDYALMRHEAMREVIPDTQEHWHWLLKTAILHKSRNSMLFRNHFSVCDVEQITQTIKTLNCLCYSHVSGNTSLYVRLSK